MQSRSKKVNSGIYTLFYCTISKFLQMIFGNKNVSFCKGHKKTRLLGPGFKEILVKNQASAACSTWT